MKQKRMTLSLEEAELLGGPCRACVFALAEGFPTSVPFQPPENKKTWVESDLRATGDLTLEMALCWAKNPQIRSQWIWVLVITCI